MPPSPPTSPSPLLFPTSKFLFIFYAEMFSYFFVISFHFIPSEHCVPFWVQVIKVFSCLKRLLQERNENNSFPKRILLPSMWKPHCNYLGPLEGAPGTNCAALPPLPGEDPLLSPTTAHLTPWSQQQWHHPHWTPSRLHCMNLSFTLTHLRC